MRPFIALAASLLCVSAALSAPVHAHPVADDPATAHFLANEAVLIEAGETKILFDPLFTNSYNTYPLVDPQTKAALMAGEAPFDGIDAVFVSHVHGDHFDAEEMNAYLAAHRDVILVAPFQARLDMRQAAGWSETFEARLRIMPFVAEPQALSLAGGAIEVTAVHIPHAGGAQRAHIQNMAYRVTLNTEATVMHLGDATPDTPIYDTHAAHFEARRTDRAFPPYWLIGRWGGNETRARLNADEITGIHLPMLAPSWLSQTGEDYFTAPGQTRGLHPHSDD
ncbi:MBL fold metallo-hydrolase [Maricaulis sp.]|uniref:MBL fold metallo-hydrolase n=1 Tax=Maricaulis sp. TaxID=1486257 RepID=UPI00261A5BD4|nr:MBL fold metallo-hydrolase [Maricaulis sp.]